jgi:hypothetical protein
MMNDELKPIQVPFGNDKADGGGALGEGRVGRFLKIKL